MPVTPESYFGSEVRKMIVIGVRVVQGLLWLDQLKSSSGIRVIRLSALQEAAAVDICAYVFACARQGLSQAVT